MKKPSDHKEGVKAIIDQAQAWGSQMPADWLHEAAELVLVCQDMQVLSNELAEATGDERFIEMAGRFGRVIRSY